MKNLEEIKRLRNNSTAIKALFLSKIPRWESNPKHYDKVDWGFNIDPRFNACKPVAISFSSYSGTYGDSGCSSELRLDEDLFQRHLVNYLNLNKDTIMIAIANSIDAQAKTLKSKAEEELNQQLIKLAELDTISSDAE